MTGETDTSYNVRQALLEDARTKNEVIEVSSMGGVVTLSGQVRSMQVAEAAEEIAKALPSVVQVINQLRY